MTRKKRPAPQPMVSIICRTVNRPTLKQAMTSVGKQDWPSIELVLVDAAGKGLDDIEPPAAHVHLSIVSSGKALNRPQAANAGLDAARGNYLLFLDDDDWISPTHISKLMNHALKHPDKQVIYSKTRKASADGKLLDEIIAVPFDRTVLRRDNFIPIHAALFSAALVRAGCRFDKNLAVYEDWDFWLQCAEHTDFKQATHIGAYYRVGGDSATMLDEHEQRYQPGHPMAEARAKLLHKWRRKWTGEQWNALLGLIDQTPHLLKLQQQLAESHTLLHKRSVELHKAHINSEQLQTAANNALSNARQLKISLQAMQENFDALQTAHMALDRGVREILNSFSWRITAPYRWTAHRIRKWFGLLPSPIAQESHKKQTQPLQAGIVVPERDDILYTRAITLQAWAWSQGSIDRIQILLDETLLHLVENAYDYEDISEAKRIGFARLIDTSSLSEGPHTISIRIKDVNGHELEVSRKFFYDHPQSHYTGWLKSHHASIQRALHSQGLMCNDVEFLITIVVKPEIISNTSIPDNNAPSNLERTLLSIKNQSYRNWKIVVAGDLKDSRLKNNMESILENVGVNAQSIGMNELHLLSRLTKQNSNKIALFLEPGEVLHEYCLHRVQQSWEENTQVLYTDHDHLDSQQRPLSPTFCFNWSSHLLLSRNYIGNVYFFDPKLLLVTDIETESSEWRYSLLLKLTTNTQSSFVTRIQEVLWSEPGDSSTDNSERSSNEEIAVRAYLAYAGIDAEVSTIAGTSCRRIKRHLSRYPTISIIIPTTGKKQFLEPCLNSLSQSTYPEIELIILDNGRGQHRDGIFYAKSKGARVIECNEEFNWSRLNNIGVSYSTGELLLFLNDDIEVLQKDWLEALTELAVLEDVGTVGCLMLYPNGTIQHGGILLVDHGGGVRHLFHKQLPGQGIYQELDQCVREVSANTGACLMIRKDRFTELGGFDETLPLVGNDIDLCLRARESGFKNIWTPHGRLIHHESVTRKDKTVSKDEESMWSRWASTFCAGDPCYNRNLSYSREDCALAEPDVSSVGQKKPINHATTMDVDHGVNLIAYIRASMGVGEAARGNAAALEASGVPYCIINYESGNPSRMDNLQWQHKEVCEPLYSINLLHINADHIRSVMDDLGSPWFQGRYNIGFWAWEMPEFPDRWLNSFDRLDEIWVPSSYVNQSIAAKSPIPVVTIPHAISVNLTNAKKYSRSHFGINERAFVFVTLFDTHSISRRKNPFGAIRAFQTAFSPADTRVQLVIKINNADEDNLAHVRSCIGSSENILLLSQHMERAHIDSLINCSDCYVSLHHAEGFGLGPAEAMAMGKVAMLTDWSGNREYMNSGNCVPIKYTLEELGEDYGPYEAFQHWAVPDIDHAASEMIDLASNPSRVHAVGERARLTITRDFSATAIGERIKTRLSIIEKMLKTSLPN